MSDCPHGMPTRKSCVDCFYEGNLEPPTPRKLEERSGHPITAAYEGMCPECRRFINVGEQIVCSTLNRWFHEECL